MRRHTFAQATDLSLLPFLYQTRTTLRQRPNIRIRRLTRSSSQSATLDAEDNPPRKKQPSFLKAKANALGTKSANRRSNPSTITPSERRVFNGIFNEIAGENTPSAPVFQVEKERDHFLDHDDILSIFSSAVSSHHAEQKALAQHEEARRSRKIGADKEPTNGVFESQEEYLLRYPRSLRKGARRAAQATMAAPKPETQIGSVRTGKSRDWISKSNAPLDTPIEEARPIICKVGFDAQEGTVDFETEPEPGATWRIGRFDPAVTFTDPGIKRLDPAIINESLDRRRAPLPGVRPSFLYGEKQDEPVCEGLRPSLLTAEDAHEASNSRSDRNLPGLPPSFIATEKGIDSLKPSFMTNKRAEDVASFAQHYGAVRPSFVRRAEDVTVIEQKLQHDPEAVFQGTINRYCQEEMEKVANAFRDAIRWQGDIGLWNTCLARVFPMIEVLETSFRAEKLGQQKLPRGQDPDISQTSTDLSAPGSPPLLDLPPYVPPLYIISRLYPAAILLAFRLFVTQFPTSPLPLALLPTIRSLGPTSYVLGASANFYNALIELRWDVYSDLRSIDALLGEMERSGVEFDIGTWNTLVKIGGERFTDLHAADGGARGAGWWGRPQNAKWFHRVVVEWKMVVAGRLRERGQGMEVSEREYGDVLGAGQGGAEQETVWL